MCNAILADIQPLYYSVWFNDHKFISSQTQLFLLILLVLRCAF